MLSGTDIIAAQPRRILAFGKPLRAIVNLFCRAISTGLAAIWSGEARLAQSIYTAFVAGTALAAAALASPSFSEAAAQSAAAAPTLRVEINIGEVLDLPAPASAIVVGNPAIANANLLDTRRVLLTGHNVGVTNLIVFDTAGRRVFDGLIEVGGLNGGQVNLFRGTTRQLLNCAGTCESVLATGALPSAGIANAATADSSTTGAASAGGASGGASADSGQ